MWITTQQAAAAQQSQATALALLPLQLLFPPVDPALQTVWRYLFDSEPWSLETMRDPLLSLVEDDRRAEAIARRGGLPFVTVEAPPEVAAIGRPNVGCYPLAVLVQVFT